MLEQELSRLIRSCVNASDVKLCHNRVRESGRSNRFLENLLLQMYGKCGCVDAAKSLFDSLRSPNIFSWNSLIFVYARNGDLQTAREVFDRMPEKSSVSWSTMIAAYGKNEILDRAMEMFHKSPCWNVVSYTAALAAFAQTGNSRECKKIFDAMPERNDLSWNTLLSALFRQEHLEEVLRSFHRMPCHSKVSWNSLLASTVAHDDLIVLSEQLFESMPERDVFSWTSLLSACSSAGNAAQALATLSRMPAINGVAVSATVKAFATMPVDDNEIESQSLEDARTVFFASPSRNLECCTAMITVFSRRGLIEESKGVFDRMPAWDIVSWTEMVAALGENGLLDRCKELFDRSPQQDSVMWTAITQAHALHRDRADEAASILSAMLQETRKHCEIYSRSKTLEQNVMASTIVIAAHARCGDLPAAIEHFDRIPQRSAVTWNAMVAALAQHGDVSAAWITFASMPERNQASWSAMIAGLAQAGQLHESRRVAARSPRKDLSNLTAIMAAYAQAGDTASARKMFDEELRDKADGVAWSTVIAIVSSDINDDRATVPRDQFFLPFREMLAEGLRPNESIVQSLICGSSHRGLLRLGREIFLELWSDHGISPGLLHYSAMVDLLGRSGRLVEAEELLTTMPFLPDGIACGTAIGSRSTDDISNPSSSSIDRDARLACRAVELSPRDAGAYIQLANIHSQT